MEEGTNHREDLFSKSIRAGKRTYFFDVKATKGNDLYMTITESKRRYNDDGKFYYEKHKLFLYKEDFDKFKEGLDAAVDKIGELREHGDFSEETPMDRAKKRRDTDEVQQTGSDSESETDSDSDSESVSENGEQYTDVRFEDLGED